MSAAAALAAVRHFVRMLVGMPSYAAYRAHMERHHPGRPVMDEAAFFRDRQQARYGGKGPPRCC
jgi:uncharacterized short protein YbdD (DUF466 family)